MTGPPQNMMENVNYENLQNEMLNYFAKKLQLLTQFGIKDVIIDVGFGFSKTVSQNHEILRYLQLFEMLNAPILVGISRKSMIYKVLETSPAEALNGTSVLNAIALLNGASIVRVHDVKEAKEVNKLLNYKDN
jgi:dihydropteroate synthase